MFCLVLVLVAVGYDFFDVMVFVDFMIVYEGFFDGSIMVMMVDLFKVIGDDYMVIFCDFDKVIFEGDTVMVQVWDLINEIMGDIVLVVQENQFGDVVYEVVDGILVKVLGAIKGWKINVKGNLMFDEIVVAGMLVDLDGYGGLGNDIFYFLNFMVQYYFSVGGGDGGVERFD